MSISFRRDFGVWWPDYDHKPEKCFSMVRAGLGHIAATVKLSGKRRVCVQAGGHAGLWPLELAKAFDRVLTFEPEPALFDCLARNVEGAGNIEARRLALSDRAGHAEMRPHCSAGSWRIQAGGGFRVECVTIDSLGLEACGAIVLDIEGHEVEALKGAADTITRFSPVLHVEVLPRAADAIAGHMAAIGYRLHHTAGRDAVYVRDR